MTAADSGPGHRRQPIRSYVLRGGRITRAQRRALDELLPRWGLPFARAPLDLDAAFGRQAPRVLEIGFGDGSALVELAALRPETDFLGVEVHSPGIGHCLLEIAARNLTNIRLIAHDAVEVLAEQIPPASLDQVLLYFPDPWPKKRHHKRRILQPTFAAVAADRLRVGGVFRLATDWQPYALQMLEVLDAEPRLANATAGGRWVENPAGRGPTRFEQRGRRLGHQVFNLEYRRIDPASFLPEQPHLELREGDADAIGS
jgi:tRNA (guanine-N7-)-methyltransferase